jgi:DNA-binding SARP family transcriptional activator/tetratricopeptide (TPR) repeat protein
MRSRRGEALGIQFGVLGPVEARENGRFVDLGPARQRYVLGALLVDANQSVSPDALVARIWGEDPPLRAHPTLRSYLSRLRSLLPTDGCSICRRSGGYVVEVAEEMVDLHRFRRFSANARDADDDTAAALLTDALALWRGSPLAGWDTPWAASIREALHAEKLTAELEYHDIQLRRGEHAAVLATLTARAEEHPLDERLARQLLLALYRSGRQAEALHRYEQLRVRLADELGVDPSPALSQLHQQILNAAPALEVTVARTSTLPPVPRQLPAPPAVFVGRADELAALDVALDRQNHRGRPIAISAVGGCGGIGKTCLALHWSHRNLDRFPDGQLYANLRGFHETADPVAPAATIRGFLDALGVDPRSVPHGLDAQAALYRSLVAEKRMLVVLDNARDTEQVLPLLPGSPTCTVIVTSRQQLAGLITTHSARPLTLDVLPGPDARELLAGHLGDPRLAREPHATADVLRRCAGLPLALSIVGARASTHPTFPLAAVAAELRDATLDTLDTGDTGADLRAVFATSYHALSTDAARLFRHLALHPGPDITPPAAASLIGTANPRVRPLLAELTRASLLTEHRPGRFTLHDLLRAYATEQSRHHDPADDRHHAQRRILDHYLHTAHTAGRLLTPTRVPITIPPPGPGVTPEDLAGLSHAANWLGAERPVILAAVRHAALVGLDEHCWQLAWATGPFLDQRAYWQDYTTVYDIGLAAAQRLGSRAAEALIHRGLARAYTRLGAYADAHPHLESALEVYHDAGDQTGQSSVHMGFGLLLDEQGRSAEAIPHVEQALELNRAAGHLAGQVHALSALGWCHARVGDHQQTLTVCAEALRVAAEVDGVPVTGLWLTLGYAHRRLGDHSRALDSYDRALAAGRELRDTNAETEALEGLGDVHHDIGDITAARASWNEAITVHHARGRAGDAAGIRRKLDDLTARSRVSS